MLSGNWFGKRNFKFQNIADANPVYESVIYIRGRRLMQSDTTINFPLICQNILDTISCNERYVNDSKLFNAINEMVSFV